MKILIVGAGVAGLSIGWRLAQTGVNITILERGESGMGASFAAAGMIIPTAEMAGAPPAEIAFAEQGARLWPGFAAEVEAASGMGVGYRQDGAVILDPWPDPLPPGTAWLDGDAVRERLPMLMTVEGALWAPGEAQADSRALSRALAAAFRRAGGQLLTGVAVTGVEADAVTTDQGRHVADAVIVAAGAWGAGLGLQVTPVKGQMIALAPPPGETPPGPLVWGNGVYLVPRPLIKERGRVLIGATVEEAGFDLTLTDDARHDLRGRAELLIPGLKTWTLVEHWAGLRPRSPDGLPLLGKLANGVFVAGGQYRNGILFAPAIADHLRDLVLGRAAVIPEFDPRRFP
jgi:glycine oxidase